MRRLVTVAAGLALAGVDAAIVIGPGPGKPFTPPPVRTGNREAARRARQEAARKAKETR